MRHVDWDLAPVASELIRPGLPPVTVDVSERPPMVEVSSYLSRALQLATLQP
jgi:hypothetical protein